MSQFYPISLNLVGKKCVVVGGGTVAARKALSLLECGANVVVVSPQLSGQLQEMVVSGVIKHEARDYRDGDVADATLAIAATNDEVVNAAVARDARRDNVLINVVDTPDLCDFNVPAVVRRGDLTVAVSTGGRSPAFARYLRRRFEALLGPEYGPLMDVVGEVREELKTSGKRVSPQRWAKVIDDSLMGNDLIALVQEGRFDEARHLLLSALVDESVEWNR